MEKYYCESCRLLYDHIKRCQVCGEVAENKIIIEVQTQENLNTFYSNE